MDALLDIIPPEMNAIFDISQADFQGGWFNSSAEISIELPAVQSFTAEPLSLVLHMDIKHGPLLFTHRGIQLGVAYVNITPDLTAIGFENLSENSNISAADFDFYLIAGLGNTVEIGFVMGEFAVADPEGAFVIEGVTGNLSINGDQSASGAIVSQEIFLRSTEEGFDLRMDRANFTAYLSNVTDPTAPGRADFIIPTVTSTAPLPFVINNITADYSLSYSDSGQDRLTMTQQFNVDHVEWDIPFQSLQLNNEVNLSRNLLERINTLSAQFQEQSVSNPGAIDSQLISLSGEITLLLLNERLAINSQLRSHAFNGDHHLSLQVTWPGLPDVTSIDTFDLADVIKAIDISLDIDADENALSLSPIAPMVDAYKQEGILRSSNGRLSLKARLAGGELIMNDEVFPLDQFIQF